MEKTGNKYLDAALHYAIDFGWAVFPVSEKTKKPYTPHGFKDAKKDPGAIKFWWKKYPNAAIGVATGSVSKLLVIDLDRDEEKDLDGYQELRNWEKEHEELPDTVRALTGRGGYHYYYKYEGTEYKNRAGLLEGIDVRGEGGYVIAPPSMHPNGTEYQWENDPDEVNTEEVNDTVRELLKIGTVEKSEGFKLPDKIEPGHRNDILYKLACSMQARGMTDEAILAAVKAENNARCDPPIEEKEITTLVGSALKYAKGELKGIKSRAGEWHEPDIKYITDKDGNVTDRPVQSIQNAMEAIEYDKALFGRLAHNDVAYAPYVFGSVPWHENYGQREWTSVDDTNLLAYIEDKYKLKSPDKIMAAFNNVTHKHHVNPIKDMLTKAHEEWDGNKHVENLLPRIVGAEKTDYNTAALRLFMMGAVSRIHKPGCKFDYMLVLVGEQGKYKSSFFRFLATSDEWMNDNFNSLDGTKAFENLRGMWIVELAELQATKRAKDVESIKAFITSTSDRYREPYSRRAESHKRQCVLAGTSNPVDFLTDRTGNRRFLPVTCGVLPIKNPFKDLENVRHEIYQAWGEIMDEYLRAGGKIPLVLSDEMQKEALKAQEAYLEEDPDVGLINEWLKNFKENRTCAIQLWKEALEHTYERYTRKDINAIHEIMKNNVSGWHSSGKQRCGDFGIQRTYDRDEPKELFVDVTEDEAKKLPFND